MDNFPHQEFNGNDLANLVKTIFTKKENLRTRIITSDGIILVISNITKDDMQIFLSYHKHDNTLKFNHAVYCKDGLYDIDYERLSEEDFYKRIKSWL